MLRCLWQVKSTDFSFLFIFDREIVTLINIIDSAVRCVVKSRCCRDRLTVLSKLGGATVQLFNTA